MSPTRQDHQDREEKIAQSLQDDTALINVLHLGMQDYAQQSFTIIKNVVAAAPGCDSRRATIHLSGTALERDWLQESARGLGWKCTAAGASVPAFVGELTFATVGWLLDLLETDTQPSGQGHVHGRECMFGGDALVIVTSSELCSSRLDGLLLLGRLGECARQLKKKCPVHIVMVGVAELSGLGGMKDVRYSFHHLAYHDVPAIPTATAWSEETRCQRVLDTLLVDKRHVVVFASDVFEALGNIPDVKKHGVDMITVHGKLTMDEVRAAGLMDSEHRPSIIFVDPTGFDSVLPVPNIGLVLRTPQFALSRDGCIDRYIRRTDDDGARSWLQQGYAAHTDAQLSPAPPMAHDPRWYSHPLRSIINVDPRFIVLSILRRWPGVAEDQIPLPLSCVDRVVLVEEAARLQSLGLVLPLPGGTESLTDDGYAITDLGRGVVKLCDAWPSARTNVGAACMVVSLRDKHQRQEIVQDECRVGIRMAVLATEPRLWVEGLDKCPWDKLRASAFGDMLDCGFAWMLLVLWEKVFYQFFEFCPGFVESDAARGVMPLLVPGAASSDKDTPCAEVQIQMGQARALAATMANVEKEMGLPELNRSEWMLALLGSAAEHEWDVKGLYAEILSSWLWNIIVIPKDKTEGPYFLFGYHDVAVVLPQATKEAMESDEWLRASMSPPKFKNWYAVAHSIRMLSEGSYEARDITLLPARLAAKRAPMIGFGVESPLDIPYPYR